MRATIESACGGHPLEGLLYAQADLKALCADRPLDWSEYAHMNEFHGNASVLKRYAGLPPDEPLPFAIEHAIPYDLEAAYEYDLNCGLPMFLAVHEESAALYRGGPVPDVQAVGFTHLYALELFERLHPQLRETPRRGTIVFPDKSTLLMDTDFDRDAFAAKLAALPEEYQPVVVCLYWRDVQRGNHGAYERAGLPLVTCGHLRDGDFLLRLHDLCRRFRYACANDIAGSFVLSILSGCHFFHLPGGPLTQRKHGRTGVHDHDPALDMPRKAACLAASPFPPASPEAQRRLARELAGVAYKKTPREIAELHACAQEALRRAIAPLKLELNGQTPLEPWHRLLPAGIDPDGWMRREACLRVARSPGVAAIRLTLDFRKPASDSDAVVDLEILVQGRPFARLRPPRFHREVLVTCDPFAPETVIRLVSSHAPLLPGEPRERSLRLSRVELMDAAGARSQTVAGEKSATRNKPATPGRRRSLLRRAKESVLRAFRRGQ